MFHPAHFLASAAFAISTLAAADEITGSGTSTTLKRELPAFTAVEIQTSGTLEINVGKAAPFEITGDDNIAPIIKTEVTGDKLLITCDKSFTTKSDLKFVVNVAELKALDVYSAATANVTGMAGQSLTMEIHGSGKVALSGKAETLAAHIRGSGKIEALRLVSRSADITITGSGSAQVNASDALNVRITGTGKVEYTGSPKVKKSITGIGSVKQVKP